MTRGRGIRPRILRGRRRPPRALNTGRLDPKRTRLRPREGRMTRRPDYLFPGLGATASFRNGNCRNGPRRSNKASLSCLPDRPHLCLHRVKHTNLLAKRHQGDFVSTSGLTSENVPYVRVSTWALIFVRMAHRLSPADQAWQPSLTIPQVGYGESGRHATVQGRPRSPLRT